MLASQKSALSPVFAFADLKAAADASISKLADTVFRASRPAADYESLSNAAGMFSAPIGHGRGKYISRQFYDYDAKTGETIVNEADPTKKYFGVEFEFNGAHHAAQAVWALSVAFSARRHAAQGASTSPEKLSATYGSTAEEFKRYGALELATAHYVRRSLDGANSVSSGMWERAPSMPVRPFWAPEEDSSLSSGLETTTQPATLAWWCSPIGRRELAAFATVMRAVGARCKSNGQDNAGLHMHVSRSAMSHEEAAALNFVLNAASWAPFTEAIAGRSVNEWCRRDPDGQSTSSEYKLKPHPSAFPEFARSKSSERYRTLNFANSHTLEVRLFKATTEPAKVLARMQFIGAVTESAKKNAKKTGNPFITPTDLRAFVAKKARGYGELKAAIDAQARGE